LLCRSDPLASLCGIPEVGEVELVAPLCELDEGLCEVEDGFAL
jgi:hypothetical protein